MCYYFINNSAVPSFVVDVSAHYDTKRAALACHRSQFAPAEASAVPTRLTASTFRQLIESRDAQFGAQIGVAFAEGLVVREPIVRASLFGPARENRHRLLRLGRRQRRRRHRTGARARRPWPRHSSRQRRTALPLALGHAGPVVRTRRHAELSAVSRTAVPAGAHEHARARVPARTSSTSSTRTTPCRTPRPPTSRTRS